MTNIDDHIGQIQDYVACLANKDYKAAQRLTLSDSVPIHDIQRRLEEYGNEITPLPANAFDLALVYQITDNQIDIYLPLWSREEGRSDLTLCMSCFKGEKKIRINDLEVL